MEVINHFSHEEHPLIINELQAHDGLEKVVCCGCQQPIISRSTYYSCKECEFFLHKACAQLPSEITHPMHPQHPLKLVAKPPYNESIICVCNICRRDWTGFTYHCSKCDFDLDVLCAQLKGTFKHSSHPHPLKFQSRSAVFKCDACGVKEEDQSYSCTVCLFWIHKTCGSMPSSSSFKYHLHTLSLAFCLPEKYRHYELECDICRKELHPSHWVLCCVACRYFIHLKCMTKMSQNDENGDTSSNSDNDPEITPNSINLPVENLSSVLIKHFLEQNGLPQVEPLSEFKHFSHHHPLTLSSVNDDYYYEFTEDDQETVCSACIEPISGSCYTCVECNYFIHSNCAHLPKDLSSSVHPEHKLSLSFHQECFRTFDCSKCECSCNGFFYTCGECDFLVDIKCALFPTTMKHGAHELLLVEGEFFWDYKCHACNREHGDFFFKCKTCPYKMATECATLPKYVRHRWDKHPLILSFPPYYYHPDKFMCDICEKEIHPKYWLYHCRECDNSFHPRCAPRIHKWRNMKFGGKVQIDYHTHPLTFVREAKYKWCCDKCGKDIKGKRVFECEPCYFNLCMDCVCKIFDPSIEESNLEDYKQDFTQNLEYLADDQQIMGLMEFLPEEV